MNAPTAITTFSQDYYRKWGRDGLASLVQHWPGKIVAYYEYEPPNEFIGRVEYRDLFAQPECAEFVRKTGEWPLMQGILPDGGYHYSFNAHKFGRKVFAITDYALEEEPFFFIGADVRALKPIPAEWINGLMGDKPGCFLLRRHLGMHVESDFAGYNTRNPVMRKMLKSYRASFINGAFLEMKGWHDCTALDALLQMFKLDVEVNNLSASIKGEGQLGYNVWPNTVLAEYLVHLKGNLKKGGVAA